MAAFYSEKLAKLYPDHLRTVRERHDRALSQLGYDAIVIAAGALRYAFLDDNAYGFRVNPHFKAWVPVIDNPNCFIIYKPGDKPQLIFFNPVDYWYKPAGTPTGFWVDQFDVKLIGDASEAKQHFPKGRAAVVAEENDAVEGAEQNPEALLNLLHYERSWKSDYEVECLREANLRGARGHVAAARAFRNGDSEYEMHLAYLRGSDATEEELPYGNIIGMNENASVLHYLGHERVRLENDKRYSFLIDAGASINGYASDITRTYSRDDGDEFAQLIVAMDEMQQSLVRSIKPGVNYIDVHMAAHRGVAGILSRFKFVNLDADAIFDKHISSTFFPHGVGHYLGLQVHDVAGFAANGHGGTLAKPEGHPFLRLTRKIEERMVFTIEPGLYFIEPLLKELKQSDNAQHVNWEKVDAFRKFGGIRIEDDIFVTATGFENMTRDAFAAV